MNPDRCGVCGATNSACGHVTGVGPVPVDRLIVVPEPTGEPEPRWVWVAGRHGRGAWHGFRLAPDAPGFAYSRPNTGPESRPAGPPATAGDAQAAMPTTPRTGRKPRTPKIKGGNS